MKMLELVNAAPALRKLAMQEIPVKTAYEIARVVRRLDEHLEFHDQKFNEMLQKYCELKDDKWFPKTPEDNASLTAERAELLELDVDLGEFKKAVVAADNKLSISAADLITLENFIEIKFEEEN